MVFPSNLLTIRQQIFCVIATKLNFHKNLRITNQLLYLLSYTSKYTTFRREVYCSTKKAPRQHKHKNFYRSISIPYDIPCNLNYTNSIFPSLLAKKSDGILPLFPFSDRMCAGFFIEKLTKVRFQRAFFNLSRHFPIFPLHLHNYFNNIFLQLVIHSFHRLFHSSISLYCGIFCLLLRFSERNPRLHLSIEIYIILYSSP